MSWHTWRVVGLGTAHELLSHPKAGVSWGGYVLEEVLQAVRLDGAYFWATHTGAELDLLLLKGGRRYGVEVGRQDAPRLTPSMRAALTDLKLTRLTVLYPGSRRYALADRVTVVPAVELAAGRADAVIAPLSPLERGQGEELRPHMASTSYARRSISLTTRSSSSASGRGPSARKAVASAR